MFFLLKHDQGPIKTYLQHEKAQHPTRQKGFAALVRGLSVANERQGSADMRPTQSNAEKSKTHTCDYCGDEFTTSNFINKFDANYCSKNCFQTDINERPDLEDCHAIH